MNVKSIVPHHLVLLPIFAAAGEFDGIIGTYLEVSTVCDTATPKGIPKQQCTQATNELRIAPFISDYIGHTRARRLLIVAPEYAMNWFQSIFQAAVLRFQDVLGIVFDSWDKRLGVKLDRELVCELIIRYVLSEQLVPASPEERRNMPRRIERMVSALVTGKTARR